MSALILGVILIPIGIGIVALSQRVDRWWRALGLKLWRKM
jgi:hypothetical protein